jgi:hypothetical protein
MSWYDSFKTGTLDYLTKGSYTSKKKEKKSASSFWADEWSQYDTPTTYWGGDTWKPKEYNKVESSTADLIKLNAHRRAIANFVNILTNKNIPVRFSRKGDSYTDGKSVVLSAEVKPEKFDIAVGLALHEASHIVLTDFELMPAYSAPTEMFTNFAKAAGLDVNDPLFSSTDHYRNKEQLFDVVKSLVNFVEDRRIDQYIYNTCPGYRDYYRALYDEYFYDKTIDKGLISDEYTDETLQSYMFRIINITNANTDLNKLKGLKEIYETLDLKNISRLKNTTDSLEVAEKITNTILQHILVDLSKDGKGKGNGDAADINEDGDETGAEAGDKQNDDMGGSGGNAPVLGEKGDSTSGNSQNGNGKDLMSDTAKKQLDKQIQKQKDFVNNNIKKKGLTKKEDETLDQMAESGTEMQSVGDTKLENGGYIQPVQCIVSKKMTEGLMQDSSFPFASFWNDKWNNWNADTLQRGIVMGTILGKRIAVRSEERETINPRQKNGRIDKRMVAALGYDYVNVFSTKEVDRFKKVMLHVTIDGSGSMSGSVWDDTLAVTIAICKAASMVSNLNVQVSIRGTWGDKPYICIAYDSRFDKFEKVKRLFPALHANGTTPEGLCYQAILKHFVESNKDMDSYFLNICDGEPTFSNQQCSYSGRNALLHTKKMVGQIKDMGIQVMSYFVGGSSYSSSSDNFKTMYGSDSRFIDVKQIVPIIKTMNELFMKKA